MMAVIAITLVVAIELSTMAFLRNAAGTPNSAPGMGGPYLALLDGILLYNVILLIVGHFQFKALTARIASIVTLILSFFGIFGALLMALAAFAAIFLMLGMFLAVPFGTIAYFGLYAGFPKMAAISTLTLIMVLKLFFLVMLFLTNPRYLQAKGLVILIGLSMLATWLTSFLISLPPGFLASITDAVGALITAIIAFIMMIAIFVSSIIAVVRALRFSRPGRQV